MIAPEIHLDLCAGIAGFSLAADWTWPGRFEHVFCEIDPYCQRVIRKHWPDATIHDDLRTMDGRRYTGRVGLLTAGIPCQPYSVAGKRGGDEDDRALWPAARRIISEARPRWVVIENVAGFVRMALDGVLADLEAEGYATGAVVIPACAVDAPHRRDRVWIVAHDESETDGEYLSRASERQAQQPRIGIEPPALANSERSGRRESLRVDPAQGSLSATIGREGASRIGSGGEALSDANGDRAQGLPIRETAEYPEPGKHRQDAPDAHRAGLEEWESVRGNDATECATIERGGRARGAVRRFEPRLGRGDDGVPAGLDFPDAMRERWFDGSWELGIPRVVTEKTPNRKHRLKGLGNAIVPVVAYEIFQAIKRVEEAS